MLRPQLPLHEGLASEPTAIDIKKKCRTAEKSLEAGPSAPPAQLPLMPSSSSFNFRVQGPSETQPVFFEGTLSIQFEVSEHSPQDGIQGGALLKKARSNIAFRSNNAEFYLLHAQASRTLRPQKSLSNLSVPYVFSNNALNPVAW